MHDNYVSWPCEQNTFLWSFQRFTFEDEEPHWPKTSLRIDPNFLFFFSSSSTRSWSWGCARCSKDHQLCPPEAGHGGGGLMDWSMQDEDSVMNNSIESEFWALEFYPFLSIYITFLTSSSIQFLNLWIIIKINNNDISKINIYLREKIITRWNIIVPCKN